MDRLAACPTCGHGIALHEDRGCTERCACTLSRRRAIDIELDLLQTQVATSWSALPRKRR